MNSWKHRPWKPSLDTLEKWRHGAVSVGSLGIAALALWFLA